MGNISTNMALALSKQNTHELLNSQKYYKIETWFREQNLDGFASLIAKQKDGEREHSQWIIEYVTDREGKITFEPIPEPILDIDYILGNDEALVDIFKFILETEIGTTASLSEIYKLAFAEGDFITTQFILDPMLKEQREEEATANTWLQKAMLIGGNTQMIFQWNESLSN